MKNYFIIFILSLVLISCREEITLDLASTNEKLVVEGYIEPGFPPYLILSNNQGYFDPLDSTTFSSFFVSEADVVVYKMDKNDKIDSLNLNVDEDIFLILGIPVFTNLQEINTNFSEEGYKYNLEILWNDKTITSSTTIPNSNGFESIFIKDTILESEKPWRCEIGTNLTDPDTIGNNYLIRSKRVQHFINKDTNDTIPNFINEPDPSFLLVDCAPDVLINGSSFESFLPRPRPEGGFPDGLYNTSRYKKYNINEDIIDSILVEEDIVMVKFCQVDEASMRFWRGVVRNSTSGGNPFAEPANLTSNIDGGLGVWTGYGTKYYKIPIIKGIIIDGENEYLPEIWEIF